MKRYCQNRLKDTSQLQERTNKQMRNVWGITWYLNASAHTGNPPKKGGGGVKKEGLWICRRQCNKYLFLNSVQGPRCRGISDPTRPPGGKRQISDVCGYGLRREICVYRSHILACWHGQTQSVGCLSSLSTDEAPRATHKEPAGGCGGQKSQSLAFSWETEKQAAHPISPYFTSQVTSLPQLPFLPKIYPFPDLDRYFIWLCSLLFPASLWQQMTCPCMKLDQPNSILF